MQIFFSGQCFFKKYTYICSVLINDIIFQTKTIPLMKKTIPSPDGTITTTEKRINAGRLAAEVDFNYLHNNRGGYYLTIHSSTNGDTPSYYVVDFGDGNDTVIYTSSSRVNITHKYDERFYNSEVTVQVTLHTVNNHYAFAQKFLTVRYKNCKKNCSAHSGTADVPHRQLNDTYFIKTAI